MQRFLDSLAALLVRRRASFVVAVLASAAVLASFIPRIQTDPSPEKLVASRDGQSEIAARLRAHFGDSDRIVVLLVQADDVLEREPLAYIHRLSRHFQQHRSIARVESVTVTPIAHRGPPRETELTLDDLDSDDPAPVAIELENAIGTIASADPERHPDGILSLAASLEGLESGPLIDGDRVTPDDAARVRSVLRDAPLLEGRLVSHDRKVAAVTLELAGATHDARARVVEEIERWIAAHPAPHGARVSAGGLPVLRRALATGIERDQRVLLPITLLVSALLLYAGLRWIGGVVLSLSTVGLTAAMVVGGMAAVGEPMNVLNEIVPTLLVIIGVSDSIHLVSRYREEIAKSPDRAIAARRTVRSLAVACFFTSITTAAGLGSLVVSRTEMLRGFGVIAGLGVMLAYLVTIALLPPALTFLRAPRVPEAEQGDGLERFMIALTRALLRHRIPVLIGAAILTVACAISAAQLEIDTRLLDPFDADDPAAITTHLLEDELQGTRPLEILLETDDPARLRDPAVLASIDAAARWAERQAGVLGVLSATDPLHEVWSVIENDRSLRVARFRSAAQVEALGVLLTQAEPNPLRAFVSEDGRILRMQVMMKDIGARETTIFVERLRSRLRARLPHDVRIAMTGEAYVGSLALGSVVDDLVSSTMLAVVVIFAMLVGLFRSFRLGLLSVPPNLITLLFTAAWMRWRGIPVDVATAIIFSIGLGLAVDASIHVLTRFQEELGRQRSIEQAILAAARGTGRGIVVSCVTLSVGFGVLVMSELVPIRQFGELIAVTIASCLVATLVVLPPLLSLFAVRQPTASPAPALAPIDPRS